MTVVASVGNRKLKNDPDTIKITHLKTIRLKMKTIQMFNTLIKIIIIGVLSRKCLDKIFKI